MIGSAGWPLRFRGLTLVAGDGSVLRCSATENADLLAAAAVGLGALGIVVEVTLQCVPTFLLRAEEATATLPEVLEQWPTWTADNDHVDLHWFPHTNWVLTKRNNRVDGPPAPLSGWRRLVDDELLSNGLLGLINEIGTRRPAWQPRINELAGQSLSPRTFTDHSAAVFVSPRRVRFVECEYAIPRASLVPVITELRALDRQYASTRPVPRSRCAPPRPTTCGCRPAASATARTSPSTTTGGWTRARFFVAFEAIVAEHRAAALGQDAHPRRRPAARAVPRFDDFLAVRDRLDPGRRFTNDHVRHLLGG